MAYIHELYEAHDVPVLSREGRQIDDALVIHAASYDRVELDRTEPSYSGRIDTLEHSLHRELHVIHCPKRCVIYGVEADRDPVESGSDQLFCMALEQRTVAGHGQLHGRTGLKKSDEFVEVSPK